MLVALTRAVSPSIGACELTHLERTPIDLALARAQHARYERVLGALGCSVRRVPDAPDLPDAVFVEDAAVVLDEVAIATRPGARSRRPEVPSVAAALAPYRPVVGISEPGTVDGGDVLVVGRRVFVGRSERTNRSGFDQLRMIVEPYGYDAACVPVNGCLHLKSAVTALGGDVLLANPAWVDVAAFAAFTVIDVDPGEPSGANALAVGGRLVCMGAFPKTRARLAAHGFEVVQLDLGELARAEGAVTCCSLIFDAPVTVRPT